jgi:hypothetical protein
MTIYQNSVRQLVQEQELDPCQWDRIWELIPECGDMPLRINALEAAVRQHSLDATILICALLERVDELEHLPRFIEIEGFVS